MEKIYKLKFHCNSVPSWMEKLKPCDLYLCFVFTAHTSINNTISRLPGWKCQRRIKTFSFISLTFLHFQERAYFLFKMFRKVFKAKSLSFVYYRMVSECSGWTVHLLCGWLCGEPARVMETISEDQVGRTSYHIYCQAQLQLQLQLNSH